MRRRGNDDFSEKGGAIGTDSEGYATGPVSRHQMMNALEMEKWRKVWKTECKVVRSNDKLVVGPSVINKRKRLDRTERSKSTDVELTA